jgi:rhodanese-related sulfurtransferase
MFLARSFIIAVALLATVFVTGCRQATPVSLPETSPSVGVTTVPVVPEIGIDAVYRLVSTAGNGSLVILDVRTLDEYRSGHIGNAINHDFSSRDFRNQVSRLNKSEQYIVYCRTSILGANAAEMMLDMGFPDVRNITGGFDAWVAAGYPVVK